MHDILIHELLIGFQPNLVIWNHIQTYGPISTSGYIHS